MESEKPVPETGNKKRAVKKGLIIAGTALVYVFFALCIALLLIASFSKRNSDGAVRVFGSEMRLVLSGSMESSPETDVSGYKIKSIKVKSLVFINCVPDDEEKAEAFYDKLNVGDVLTFQYVYATQEIITHRLVEKTALPTGGYKLVLEGDNKTDGDVMQQVIYTNNRASSPNYVIGKVTGKSYVLGLIVYALQNSVGIALIIIVPCTLVIAMEGIRIGSVLSARKKEKFDEEHRRQTEEIDELKRKIAMLEKNDVNPDKSEDNE